MHHRHIVTKGHYVDSGGLHQCSCEHSFEDHMVTGGDCISATHAISEDGDELNLIGEETGEGGGVSGFEGFDESLD